jgi:hypothetical protein
MRINLFSESIIEHSVRIDLPEDHIRMLRRALTLKREGYPPESVFVQMGADHVTWPVATSTLDELELELDVLWEDARYIPGYLAAPTTSPQADADVPHPPAHVGKKLLLAHYGLYQGKQPPYGYLFDSEVRIKTADGRVVTGHSLIPDPDTVTLVEIVASLNICGVASPEGASWDERQVGAIVRHAPLYAGFIGYRDAKHKQTYEPEILYPGRHTALIDLTTTLAVLAITGRTLEWEFAPTRKIAGKIEEWA